MKNRKLSLIGLVTGLLSLTLNEPVIAQTCLRLPSTVISQAANVGIDYLQPRIHLNQVNHRAVDEKWENIYLPNDNWVEAGGYRFSLNNFGYYQRPRRSHFIADFNSRRFTVFPIENGLRLRVEFETDGMNEIKGWCHACKIKARRDRATADIHIQGRSGAYPAIEATLNFAYNSGVSTVTLRDVYVDMNLDGNGFLELIDGLITSGVRREVERAIYQAWNQSSEVISQQISRAIRQELNSNLGDYQIQNIRFEGQTATVCIQDDISQQNPSPRSTSAGTNRTETTENNTTIIIDLEEIGDVIDDLGDLF